MQRYMTVAEVARCTGIPKRTLYDAIAREEMPVLAPNGCKRGWRIGEKDVERWLRESTRRGR